MKSDPNLVKFIETARGQGASDQSLAGLLKGRGWPEEAVHRVLGDHYEKQTGISIPEYRRAGAAKDAFLYLLAFATLATWTIELGSLLFTLIDRWIPDPVTQSPYYYGQYQDYAVASSMASIIVAFPIYLVVMRLIVRDLEQHPEKSDSGVRKWLGYIALLIAAGVIIGDLITFLTFLLRGELTSRFVTKVATVLIISGGVFWYYLGSFKKTAAGQGIENE